MRIAVVRAFAMRFAPRSMRSKVSCLWSALRSWISLYRAHADKQGVPVGSPQEFRRRFDFVGAQLHLKVCGIFARLYLRDGKAAYLQDIPLTLEHLQTALRP